MQTLRLAAVALGLTVSVSPDGLHALMSAVRDTPELIILDEDLPGVDADWVEQMLARDGRTAGARVVRVAALTRECLEGAPDDEQDPEEDRRSLART